MYTLKHKKSGKIASIHVYAFDHEDSPECCYKLREKSSDDSLIWVTESLENAIYVAEEGGGTWGSLSPETPENDSPGMWDVVEIEILIK